MKFADIYQYLFEQGVLDLDHDDDNGGLDVPDPNDIEPPANNNPEPPANEEPEQPAGEEPELPADEEPEQDENGIDSNKTMPETKDILHRQKTINKKLKAIDLVKQKWREEAEESNLNISEADMDDAINFFNAKKNQFRPLTIPPSNRDIPQLFALQQRFPSFPGTDKSKIKDIQTYSWAQITFLRERYVDVVNIEEERNIEEFTPDQEAKLNSLLNRAHELWDNLKPKVYDNGTVSIAKIESKQMATTYGLIQNALHDTYNVSSSNYWCITRTDYENLYNTYRDVRAFYYVLNKNLPQNHDYYFFAIGARKDGQYTLTNLYNTVNTVLSFSDLVSATGCDELIGIKDKLVYFGKTKEEDQERIFDSYTFYGKREDETDEEYQERLGNNLEFITLTPSAQFAYIESGRNIKSGLALRALGKSRIIMPDGTETEVDLQKEYVRRTTLQNYKDRYITTHPTEDSFEMINALRTSIKRFLHNVVLIHQLGITDGISAITTQILEKTLIRSWKDYNKKDIRLFQSKNTANLFGVYNIYEFKWEKPLEYIKQSVRSYVNLEDRNAYVFIKYVSPNDYFYWVFNRENLLVKNKNNPNYLKGIMMEGSEGDELIGKYKKI